MSALQPLQDRPGTVNELLHAVAAGTAVGDVVGDQVKHLRTRLHAEVDRLSDETGAAFTARVGGVGSALLTDPQPKPRVLDRDVFGHWLATNVDPDGDLGLVTSRQRVEVVDHDRAAAAILDSGGGDPTQAAVYRQSDRYHELRACLEVATEWLPSESALDVLLEKRWAAVRSDGDGGWLLVAVDGDGLPGDAVEGVTVSCGEPQLQVRLEKQAREAAKAQVRQALGLSELDGGA
jgi:hypothetical protein